MTVNSHGQTVNGSNSRTEYRGVKILAKKNGEFNVITKFSASTASRAAFFDSGKNLLATAAFSTHTATFSPVVTMTSGSEYYAMCDASGGSYTSAYFTGTSYPYVSTDINFTNGIYYDGGNFSSETTIFNVESITTSVNVTIQPSLLNATLSQPTSTDIIIILPSALEMSSELKDVSKRRVYPPNHVVGATGTMNTKATYNSKKYPLTEGLTLGTTKLPLKVGAIEEVQRLSSSVTK
jgi:hypothetical protein